MFQVHVVQFLQNELESLRAQLTNMQGKSSQPPSQTQPVHGPESWEGPRRSFYGLPHDAMVGKYVFCSAHSSIFTLEFAIFLYLSYVTTQEASVAPKVSTIRQVI